MENVNWLKLKLNQKAANILSNQVNAAKVDVSKGADITRGLVNQTTNNIINNVKSNLINPQQLSMNNLASIDRSVYVKNLLNLPQNMVELLVMVQNQNKAEQTFYNKQANSNQQLQNNEENSKQNSNKNLDTGNNSNVKNNQNNTGDFKKVFNNENNVRQNIKQNNIPQNVQRGNVQPANQNSSNNLQNVRSDNQQFQQPNNLQTSNNSQNIRPNNQHSIHSNNQENVKAQKNIKNLHHNQNHVRNTDIKPQNQQMQNIRQNPQSSTGDVRNTFIENTQQQVRQNAINTPLNQLHNMARSNIMRNSLRNSIINNTPTSVQNENVANQIAANDQQGMTAEELANFKQQLASQLNQNVSLSNVSALLQKNGKLAMNKMMTMMTMVASQGIGDITPLKETMAAINSSIAATSQNDSVQTLKNLMLLYLPWLPLQEGVGFDLEIEKNKEHIDSDSTIKIKITTVNYGNLQASVTLMSTNSVDVQIVCSEKFPKKHLLKKLNLDSRQHSMQANIDIQAQKPQLEQNVEKPKAKVNLSNVNEVNPYLLLICHAIIRHTIEIDTLTTLGQFSEDI